MKFKHQFLIGSIGGVVFIVLKLFFKNANPQELLFLLKPVSYLLELTTGHKNCYIHDQGFYFQSLNIIVSKACSGFTFLLLSMVLTICLLLKYCGNCKEFFKKLVIGLLFSYLLTILVNTTRILSLIWLSKERTFSSGINTTYSHEMLGALIYLSYLTGAYLTANNLLIKKRYENITQS